MIRRTTTVALALTLALAGCSGDAEKTDAPAPSTPASSSAASPTSGVPAKDASKEALGYTAPKDAATVESKSGRFSAPVTLHVVSVASGDGSTVLTYYMTSKDGALVGEGVYQDWTSRPVLKDVGSGTEYVVNTYEIPSRTSDGTSTLCVCSGGTVTDGKEGQKKVFTAQYPELPTSVNTVTVVDPNFGELKVPVSRN